MVSEIVFLGPPPPESPTEKNNSYPTAHLPPCTHTCELRDGCLHRGCQGRLLHFVDLRRQLVHAVLVVELHGGQSGVRVLVRPERPPNVDLGADRPIAGGVAGSKNRVINKAEL